MGLLLGQAEGPGREGDGRGRAGDAEEGGMLLHEAHEGPFADEAHVLLEVAEEEGLGLGLDEGGEVENYGCMASCRAPLLCRVRALYGTFSSSAFFRRSISALWRN